MWILKETCARPRYIEHVDVDRRGYCITWTDSQSSARRFVHRDIAVGLAAALGDVKVVRLRKRVSRG